MRVTDAWRRSQVRELAAANDRAYRLAGGRTARGLERDGVAPGLIGKSRRNDNLGEAVSGQNTKRQRGKKLRRGQSIDRLQRIAVAAARAAIMSLRLRSRSMSGREYQTNLGKNCGPQGQRICSCGPYFRPRRSRYWCLGLRRGGLCPLWVKSRHCSTSASCPLYPQKRTLIERVGMSALCQKRTCRVTRALG
jgi:hypothetical protein